MAPNLAPSKYEFIHDMISNGELSTSLMAQDAGYSKGAMLRISNIGNFGSVKRLPSKVGRTIAEGIRS